MKALALLLLAPLALAPQALSDPLGNAPCPDAAAPQGFAGNPTDLENLHFHAGLLYVTGDDGKLHAFDRAGRDTVVATLGARSGAMVTAPDGALVVRVGSTELWRFPQAPGPGHEVFVRGLTGANGLALDRQGNYYVSDEGGDRVWRVPAGSRTPEVWAHLPSPNGLAIDDARGLLYAAETTDQRSSVAVVRLSEGALVRELHATFGAVQGDLFHSPPMPTLAEPSDPTLPWVPKGIDDLTLAGDGNLYLAAWLTGEVLRMHPQTGATCTLASGIAQPSSVRVARGFGAASGDLFVTDFGGPQALLGVDVSGGHVSRVPLGLPE